MLRDFRKPVVLAAPKIGLKHPKAVSNIDELAEGTKFEPILVKDFGTGSTDTVFFCSGKIGFDIEDRLTKADLKRGAKLIRIEELAPFPVSEIREALRSVDAKNHIYVQEESVNQGAFQWAKLHLDRMLADQGKAQMNYVGKESMHSYCAGSGTEYKSQVKKLWNDFNAWL
jgi:2-oxoglutarate dehydrogenase complex dehydrogenase (E1) component-like enzyme